MHVYLNHCPPNYFFRIQLNKKIKKPSKYENQVYPI